MDQNRKGVWSYGYHSGRSLVKKRQFGHLVLFASSKTRRSRIPDIVQASLIQAIPGFRLYFYQLHQQSRGTQLAALYPLSPIGDYLHDLMGAQLYLQNEMALLRPDPLGWLKAKGCLLSSARRIVALYRIRNVGSDEIGTENRLEDFMISTFAYGIAIWGEPNKGVQPTANSLRSAPAIGSG